jgi:acid phosphatase family membrane protein YuiD
VKPSLAGALADLVHNRTLWAPIVALVAVQLWKFGAAFVFWHKFEPSLLWSTGGMPSSHSALVSALAVSIGINAGFGSPTFAVALALAIVVMYDAAGVRQAAGKQAQKINRIVEELLSGHWLNDEHLRELLGHTPFQVTVGAVVGVFAGWLLNL